jgi:hypothetical protein
LNPAVKYIVNNYCFVGLPSTFFAQHVPTIVVGSALADSISKCPQNPAYMQYAMTSRGLVDAIRFASKTSGTEKIIIFDGAVGGFNVTEPLADLLRSKAPGIEDMVETQFLPNWCRQRNLKLDQA